MLNKVKNINLNLIVAILLVGFHSVIFGQVVAQDSTYTDNSYSNLASSKGIYQYNSDGESIGYEYYSFDIASNKWIGSSKQVSTYVEGATSFSYVNYLWDAEINDWGDHYQKTESDVVGGVTTSTTYLWDAEINDWGDHYQKTESDVVGGSTTSTTYLWNSVSQVWELSDNSKSKSDIEKNSDNQITQMVSYSWSEETKSWVGNFLINYEYDNNGNNTLLESSSWDSVDSKFSPSIKLIYTYDSKNNVTNMIYYLLDKNSQFYKYFEYIYENSYDSNNNLSEVITKSNYFTLDIPLAVSGKVIHFYDDNNNKIETISYSWDRSNECWLISRRQTFFTKDLDQTFNSISPSKFGVKKESLFEIPILEKPMASSREWKYKKDLESVFSSFYPQQTKPILSKTFNEPADYQVICESVIEGSVYTSNTAKIKVVGIDIAPVATQSIDVEEFGSTLTVNESPKADGRYWYYSEISGGTLTRIHESSENYTPKFSVPGRYFVVCKSEWDNTFVTSNEIIVNVSGTKLSSIETQLLKVGDEGTSISVIEYPASDSKEWKYKTSETGIWKSFLSKVTTSDYTPNFSSIGKYYVACFSEFGNNVQMSDVIKVRVVDQNKIDPVAEQTIDVLENGMELTVTELPIADSRAWYSYRETDGVHNYIAADTLYTPNFNQSGVFYVVCKSEYDGIELTSNPIKINVVGNDITPSTNQSYIVGGIGTTLKVNESTDASSREWKYKTTESGVWMSFNPIQDSIYFTPSFSTSGIYYISNISTIGGKEYSSNEVKVRVIEPTNSTPSISQNIDINVDGGLLTVYEDFIADSRYWHVSRTSGEYSYQTNTYKSTETYLPNFSESGTYYIVCQSKWDNATITSNEVVINVNGYGAVTFENSISPNTEQIIDIYTDGTDLTVLETPVADSRYWYYSKNDSNNFSEITYKTSESYTPLFSSLGVNYVICKSKLDTLYTESNPVKISVYGNKISSTSTQDLVAGYSGEGVSVEEYPVATSREWKYKLTSSGAWQSFATPETSLVYTPSFALSGDYYVACFSTINGKEYETRDVEIRVSSNSITPITTQNISLNSNGNVLTVNEEYSSSTREWYASTTPGKEYFNYLGEGTTYVPNISEAGVYYVVCKSIWDNGFVYSNEVQINVSGNNILPANDQVIIPSASGSPLIVNEYPVATSREWKYKLTLNGMWQSFSNSEINPDYTPNFAVDGEYYVACFSVINGITYASNEVMIAVANNSISPITQQIISPNTDGTRLTFTESIESDSKGWFYSELSGSNYEYYLGDESTYTPNFSGIGEYFVVFKSNWGNAIKISNEVRIDVAGNNIYPINDQNITANLDGSSISVNEHPFATSREWKYKTSLIESWKSFALPKESQVYIPNFKMSGVYYIACFSEIGGEVYESNTVTINVEVATSVSLVENNNIRILPSSANGNFIVHHSDELESISVYSINGKIIFRNHNILSESTMITVPIKGIHFIVLRTKDGRNLIDKLVVY